MMCQTTAPTPQPASPSPRDSPPLQSPFGLDPIPGIMPAGGVNILGGLPFAGKSRLLAWWASAWTHGGDIFGIQVPKLNIGVLSTDRGYADSTHWFEAYDVDDLPVYSPQDDPNFDWKRLKRIDERLTALEASLSQTLEVLHHSAAYDPTVGTLVLADTITAFVPSFNRYDKAFVAISRIRQLARRRGVTLLSTIHTTAKQRLGARGRHCRYIDRIAGSVAISGPADTMMYIAIPDETPQNKPVFEWCPHHAKAQQFVLEVEEDGRFRWDAGGC